MDLETSVKLKMRTNKYLSEHAKQLICHLIVADPDKRLSAQAALKEPWFGSDIPRISLLNKAVSHLKDRTIRKSMGLYQIEKVPIHLIRTNELLKSGLDMSNDKFAVKRSVSVSEPYFNSFTDKNPSNLKETGGRMRFASGYQKEKDEVFAQYDNS